MITTFLLVFHLFLVQHQGMSKPIGEKVEREMPFVPDFLYREMAVWAFSLLLLAFLSVYFPFDAVLRFV